MSPDSGQVTYEGNIDDNDLDQMIPKDVSVQAELKFKQRKGRNLLKKKIKRKNSKRHTTNDTSHDDTSKKGEKLKEKEKPKTNYSIGKKLNVA